MKPVVPPFMRKEGFGTLGLDFDQPPLPPPVELRPVTWGAWLTLIVLLAGLFWIGWVLARHAQRGRPRRAALRALRCIDTSDSSRMYELLPLLKTLALDSYARSQVAALSGARFVAFLIESAPRSGFDGPAGEALILLAEQGGAALTVPARNQLVAASARWIKSHHAGGHDA